MANEGRNYYRIPTVAGDFYFYREYKDWGYDNATLEGYVEYNYFVEFFTGLSIGEIIPEELFNIDDPKGAIKFKLIREELAERSPELNEQISYNNWLSYNVIRFSSTCHSIKYGFPTYVDYTDQLPYHSAEFITDLTPALSEAHKLSVSPLYKYYLISASEFADGIKSLIDEYGSKEKVKEVMLERIKKQALVTKERDEDINAKETIDASKEAEAEEYIKKYI